jgi:hypothetical protein
MVCKITTNEEQLAGHSQRARHLWIVDAGASHHICFEKSLFKTLNKNHQVSIQAGTSTTTSHGRGQVDLDIDGYTLSLYGALYAPQLRFNLLSTECLRRENFIGYDSIPNTLYNGENDSVIAIADSSSGIPIISTNSSIPIHLPEGSSTWLLAGQFEPSLYLTAEGVVVHGQYNFSPQYFGIVIHSLYMATATSASYSQYEIKLNKVRDWYLMKIKPNNSSAGQLSRALLSNMGYDDSNNLFETAAIGVNVDNQVQTALGFSKADGKDFISARILLLRSIRVLESENRFDTFEYGLLAAELSAGIGIVQPYTLFWSLPYTLACTVKSILALF